LKLEGNWKLVLSPSADTEFLIIKAQTKDGQPAVELVNFHSGLGPFELGKIEQQGEALTLTFNGRGVENEFKGKLVKDGEAAGQVLGTCRFLGRSYPARLEKTAADKVSTAATAPPGYAAYLAATRERDAKAKMAKLEAAIAEMKGPAKSLAYQALLASASSAGLTEDQVRKYLSDLLDVARPYGEELVLEYRTAALKSLQGTQPYAALAFELAVQAEKELPKDATLDQQSAVLTALAASAKLAGKNDLYAATAARLEKIEHELDEEYHRTVPPFKPEKFAGRTDPAHDRVVLMELFTGAQCPPCVAADVAFDALHSTYQPTELVTLQYHLHIPGPDPMTNADSEGRAKYYAANSTPSTYFNGAADARGGGGMANAEAKYGQYRGIIEKQLEGTKAAKLDLKATRSGDRIVVSGTAQALDPPVAKEGDKPQLRLRLVLTEEIVKYVGGNRLRFHHHVVRGFAGGIEGKELAASQTTVKETIDLAEVRKVLAKYVEDFAQTRGPFANTPPEMGNELSVVAFVQNDADKSVLHAVRLPVARQ
jgi:hypothetical protein